MSNVTRLPGTPEGRRYQAGDLARALNEGLRHEEIAEDIEMALYDLLFIGGEEDVLVAREMLANLMHTLPEHTRFVDGVAIDPDLPQGFDVTPNDERPDSHQVWWYRPFIATDRHEPESWEEYRDRLASYGYEPDQTPEQWAKFQAKQKAGWFKSFPSGVRYDVRCLDGGAWDRSTWWGSAGTLDEAIQIAKTGPKGRAAQ
jgi:hypothetical protein